MNPRPLSLARRAATTGAALALLALAAGPASGASSPPETVKFRNGAVTLTGTLELPDTPAPHPAVILLTGSDPSPRDAPFFEDLRRRFTERGFAALSYDKRGVGDSEGRYEETPDFNTSAGDGLAALRMLRGRADIDSTRIGVWGVSQGGWIAMLMASKSRQVAFVINVSGPGVSPFEQTMFQRAVDLAERGVPPEQVKEAMGIRRAVLTYLATGNGAAAANAAWKGASSRPWFRAARETDRWFESLAPMKTIPPPSAMPRDVIATLRRTYAYDPAAVATRIRVPVLSVFGGKDRHIPVEASVTALKSAFRRSGNHDATVRVFPNGGHALQIVDGPAECLRCMEEKRRQGALIQVPVEGFYALILGWAEERFGPPEARVRNG